MATREGHAGYNGAKDQGRGARAEAACREEGERPNLHLPNGAREAGRERGAREARGAAARERARTKADELNIDPRSSRKAPLGVVGRVLQCFTPKRDRAGCCSWLHNRAGTPGFAHSTAEKTFFALTLEKQTKNTQKHKNTPKKNQNTKKDEKKHPRVVFALTREINLSRQTKILNSHSTPGGNSTGMKPKSSPLCCITRVMFF